MWYDFLLSIILHILKLSHIFFLIIKVYNMYILCVPQLIRFKDFFFFLLGWNERLFELII